MIRLTIPSLDDDDFEAVRDVLASGYLVQGVRVAAFEQAVAAAVGVEHAIAVSNCTAALHLALLALGIGAGDLVAVTAYSFVATANVIELCGARPLFVDIDRDTFNLDVHRLEETLRRAAADAEQAGRVKAILPVHTFGQMADMAAIGRIAEQYGVPVIEDAACALGATWDGRQAGAWGQAGCFSFHPRKAITTGEGGMVTTSDARLADTVRALRNHGQQPGAPTIQFVRPGFNYRLTDLQGALGVSQMNKLERVIGARRRLAATYDALLENTPLQAPVVAPAAGAVYQSYVVLLPPQAAARRDEIVARLKAEGIETTIGTWHMPLTGYYAARYGCRPGDFPAADQVFARSITLPLYETLAEAEQEQVVGALTGLL